MFSRLILAFCFFVHGAWANEGAEKKPEGGEGKEAAGPAVAAKDEYQETMNKVLALKSKIKLRQETIQKLILDKQTEKDSKKLAEIIKSMMVEHKSMQQEAEEYNQQSSIIRYRFPEKTIPNGKKFEKIEIKELEKIENEFTLDAKIKKAVAKIKEKYPEADTGPAKPNTGSESKESKNKNIEPGASHLTEPVLIEK